MKIQSLLGIGNITFGSTKDEIQNILGKPSSIQIDEWPDQTKSETWLFEKPGLELAFDEEDNYRLGTITTTSREAVLENIKPIGLNINAIIKYIPSVILEEDLGGKVKNYIYPKKEISLWVINDIVKNLSLFPEYDETNEFPIWPKS